MHTIASEPGPWHTRHAGGAHRAPYPCCAKSRLFWTHFPPESQGDCSNYCVSIHRTTQILTQSKNKCQNAVRVVTGKLTYCWALCPRRAETPPEVGSKLSDASRKFDPQDPGYWEPYVTDASHKAARNHLKAPAEAARCLCASGADALDFEEIAIWKSALGRVVRYLNLQDTTAADPEVLVVAQCCPNLRRINLEGTEVTDICLDYLMQNCPHVDEVCPEPPPPPSRQLMSD